MRELFGLLRVEAYYAHRQFSRVVWGCFHDSMAKKRVPLPPPLLQHISDLSFFNQSKRKAT